MSEGYLSPVDDVKEEEKETSTIENNTPQDTTTPNVTIVSALLPVRDTAPQQSTDDSEESGDEGAQSIQDESTAQSTEDIVDVGKERNEEGATEMTSELVSEDGDTTVHEVAQDTPAVAVDMMGEETTETGSDVSEAVDISHEGNTDNATSQTTTSPGTTPLTGAHKMQVVLKALRSLESNLSNVIALLEADLGGTSTIEIAERLRETSIALPKVDSMNFAGPAEGGRVIEGVFNGNNMVGSDGELYTVPPNYASKSKLVEGDLLKLTITPKGSFIYKQIGPIERSRVIGTIGYDQTTGEWYATTDNRRWNVIKASVTYFKGDTGDEIVLLVPKNAPSKWAAVENIIKQSPLV